jgi:general secretion pathway protein C
MAATLHSLSSVRGRILSTGAEAMQRLVARPSLPLIINSAAVLLLASSAAQWTWELVPIPVPDLPRVAVAATSDGDSFDLQALLAAHLFGQAAMETALAATSVEQIPTSSLNFVLTGVVAAGADSLALIRVNDEPESPFAVNEQITHGVILRAVYPDRVIIERRGHTEALLLEQNAAPAGETPATSPAANTVPGIQPGATQNSYTVNRDFASNELSNPDVFRQALIIPNAAGGFLVRQIKPGSVYEKLGLRVGDIIRKVNGREVNTIDEVLRVYQQLGGVQKAGDIELEIMRGGQPEQLRYSVQ